METEETLYDSDTFDSINNFPANISNAEKIMFPTRTIEFQILLRVVVSVSSILSIIGSSAIILSYALMKELRTLARHTLVCLAVADLLLNVSGLLGIISEVSALEPNESDPPEHNHDKNSPLGNWCKTQAVFLVFGTESSILWTMGVAIYMFALVVVKPKIKRWGVILIAILHIFCWGIPFILTLWLLLAGFLWFDSAATPGFCAIVGRTTHTNRTVEHHEPELYPIIVGYEMWLYIAFFLLPALYIALSCHIRKKHNVMLMKAKATKQDLKLIAVPLVFLFLRLWSVLVDICVYYLPLYYSVSFRKSYASAILILMEGIGDTAQGAVNAVIFCLLKPIIRAKIYKGLTFILCCKRSRYEVAVEEESTQILSPSITADEKTNETDRALLLVASQSYSSTN